MTVTPAALPGAAGVGNHEIGWVQPESSGFSPARQQAPELRPYQVATIDRIAAEAHRRILVSAPTGSGKTVVASAITRRAVTNRLRVLFLVHRRELVRQTSLKLFEIGIDHGITAAGFPARPGEPVQVASVQTLHARAMRSRSIELPEAEILIVDECHHCRADTWQKIIDAYPSAKIIGLTATPCRGDGRGLGNVFETIIETATVADLIRDGYLVPTKVYAPTRPDLTGIRVERGDYVESQLSERMNTNKLVGDVIEHWHRLSQQRKTVVFAVDVAHSVHLRNEFRQSGVLAEHIDGSTPRDERDNILAKLASGKIEIVTNCQVLTEGWDCPEVGCIVLARPTKSIGLFRQMVGRVLRPAPGKENAIVIDHAGAVFQHGFVDDPIEWTLHEDERAENKTHGARGQYNSPSLTTCPECTAVRFEGQPCSSCGWHPVAKPKGVIIADGDLGEVDRNRDVGGSSYDGAARCSFYRQLLQIAAEKNRSTKWAAHSFRNKFGEWPPWSWQHLGAETPDPSVRAWVRSRDIAYARSMAAGAR